MFVFVVRAALAGGGFSVAAMFVLDVEALSEPV